MKKLIIGIVAIVAVALLIINVVAFTGGTEKTVTTKAVKSSCSTDASYHKAEARTASDCTYKKGVKEAAMDEDCVTACESKKATAKAAGGECLDGTDCPHPDKVKQAKSNSCTYSAKKTAEVAEVVTPE